MGDNMAGLDEKTAEFIKKHSAFVATTSEDGTPNFVCKCSIQVLYDEHLVYSDLLPAKTTENLKKNPRIAVAFVDTKSFKGVQIKGTAELIDSGDLYERMVKFIEKLPMDLPKPRYAVKIHIEGIYDLTPGKNAGKKVS